MGDKRVSKELKNLILSLLKVNPKERLGYCNFNSIKTHPFFSNFDWFKYSRKQLLSPLANIINSKPAPPVAALPKGQKPKRKTSADRETACD